MPIRVKPKTGDGAKIHSLRTTLQGVSAKRRAEELRAKMGLGTGVTKIRINKPSTEPNAVGKDNLFMRRLWNRSMPVLSCTNCSFSSQCPKFRAGYECAFLPFFTSHTIETPQDILFYSKELLQQGLRRMQQAFTFETMSGAAPSIELSEQISNLFAQLMSLYDTMKSDSAIEIETNSETVLGSLFGDSSSLIESTEKSLAAITDLNASAEITDELKKVETGRGNAKVHQDLLTEMAKTGKNNNE